MTATHCNTVDCNTLQHTATQVTVTHCDAGHCITLQHLATQVTATHCNTDDCNTMQHRWLQHACNSGGVIQDVHHAFVSVTNFREPPLKLSLVDIGRRRRSARVVDRIPEARHKYQKRPTYIKRVQQKRPTCIKRDLQKRPTKETYTQSLSTQGADDFYPRHWPQIWASKKSR